MVASDLSQAEVSGVATYVKEKIEDIKRGAPRRTLLDVSPQLSGVDPQTAGVPTRWSVIGAADFSTVYKAEWTFTAGGTERTIHVAVKILGDEAHQTAQGEAAVKVFIDEVHTWASIPTHLNVLPLVGIYFRDRDRKRGIVAPFVKDGDVKGWLDPQNKKNVYGTYGERLKLVLDIAEGLNHLHANDIIHGDLHSGNVLLLGNTALLTDFGLSQRAGSDLNRKDDIYMFGVLALQVMSRIYEPAIRVKDIARAEAEARAVLVADAKTLIRTLVGKLTDLGALATYLGQLSEQKFDDGVTITTPTALAEIRRIHGTLSAEVLRRRR